MLARYGRAALASAETRLWRSQSAYALEGTPVAALPQFRAFPPHFKSVSFCTASTRSYSYYSTSPTATLITRGWLRDQQRSRLYREHIMAQDLKFASSNVSFVPETVNLLSDAFESAWQRVRTSGNRLARPGYANVMREVMAKHIVNLAEHGERDESALSNSAFHFFTTNYKA
jgi:hypothetical protein